jgi:hypothetical protein
MSHIRRRGRLSQRFGSRQRRAGTALPREWQATPRIVASPETRSTIRALRHGGPRMGRSSVPPIPLVPRSCGSTWARFRHHSVGRPKSAHGRSRSRTDKSACSSMPRGVGLGPLDVNKRRKDLSPTAMCPSKLPRGGQQRARIKRATRVPSPATGSPKCGRERSLRMLIPDRRPDAECDTVRWGDELGHWAFESPGDGFGAGTARHSDPVAETAC